MDDIILAQSKTDTQLKEIVISEYQGVKRVQVRQRWKKREEKDTEWKFSKKIVSFDFDDLQDIEKDLKKNQVSFEKMLLEIENPEKPKKEKTE